MYTVYEDALTHANRCELPEWSYAENMEYCDSFYNSNIEETHNSLFTNILKVLHH